MRGRGESGQALVLTALALVALLAIVGLAVDMGVLRYDKRVQQTAADAAALAGANNLNYNGGAGVTAAALSAASANGFADDSGNGGACSSSGPLAPPTSATIGWTEVTICSPPSSLDPYHAQQAGYVEAWVTRVQPTYFMRILGVTSQVISARAVATNVSGVQGSGSGCVDTLGAPMKKIEAGVNTSGSVTVYAPSCAIQDNGNMIANGGTNLNITAAAIGVSGSYTDNGTGTISPSPVNTAAIGDPISVTAPCSGTSCPSGPSVQINNGGCVGGACPAGVACDSTTLTCTVAPGYYEDICISGSTVNFNPGGLYVITGGAMCNNSGPTEFQVNGNSTICNSTGTGCSGMPGSANSGVTFYMTGTGSVSIDGTSTVELTAPNSGTYEGLLFYQDPLDTASATLSGNNNSFYQGALYFPTAQLTFGGNNTTCVTGTDCTFNSSAAYTLIVSSWLTFAGNPTIILNSNYSGLAGNGGPLSGAITSARLVE